ncbi:hypothetical protein [Streptomyces sp. NPDC088915]|uniref:hypothetical protein n=1 Tax=Streptomyces sp. NPDC088915 TaxID=3365912 RepID=UPI0037FADA71
MTMKSETRGKLPNGLAPLLTTAQLMTLYGVSNWTVNQWVRQGCPMEPTVFRGRRFDLDQVRGWIHGQIQKRAGLQ